MALAVYRLNRHIARLVVAAAGISRNHDPLERVGGNVFHAPDLERQIVALARLLTVDIAVLRADRHAVLRGDPQLVEIQTCTGGNAIARDMQCDVAHQAGLAVAAQRQAEPTDIARFDRHAAVAVPCGNQLTLFHTGAVLHGVIARARIDLFALKHQLQLDVRAKALGIDEEPQHFAAGPVGLCRRVGLEVQGIDIRPAITAVKACLKCAGLLASLSVRAQILRVVQTVIGIVIVVCRSPAGGLKICRELFHIPNGRGRAPLEVFVLRKRDAHAVRRLLVVAHPEGVNVDALSDLGFPCISNVQLQERSAAEPVGEGSERNTNPAGKAGRKGKASVAAARPCLSRKALRCGAVALGHGVILRTHNRACAVDPEVELHAAGHLARVHPEPEHLAARPVALGGSIA